MDLFDSDTDFFERVRRTVLPPLGTVVQFINELGGLRLYVRSNSNGNEFVGRVSMNEEPFERKLESIGFERNPLASLKQLASTGELEEGSFRWVPPAKSMFDESKQLHVILYDGSHVTNAETGYTYIYAHWEYRWDVYPLKHYRKNELDVQKGIGVMQNKLDTYGIEYDDVQPSVE